MKKLEEIFLEELNSSRYLTSFPHTYKTLFNLKRDYSFLKSVYEDYMKSEGNNKEWFISFHKSIRQCGFFCDDISCSYVVDIRSDEEKQRYNKLRDLVDVRFHELIPDQSIDFKESQAILSDDKTYQHLICEIRSLNKLKSTLEPFQISGSLDAILHNTISDDGGTLLEILERTFMEFTYQLQKI
jgi:hypothetical protein